VTTSFVSARGQLRKAALAVCLTATLAASLAACSSSGGSGGPTTGSSGSASQPAASVSAPASGTAPAGSGSASAGAGSLADQAAALMKRPTSIPFVGPKITTPIPTGKTIDTIDCGQTACQQVDQLLTTATAIVGWKTNVLKTDGTPQQLANAWQQVIREKPYGVLDQGAGLSEVGTYVKQAVAEGIVVIGTGIPEDGGVDGLLATVQDGNALGKAGSYMATWVAAQAQTSGGAGGALFLNLPDFPILQSVKTDFQSGLAADCSSCAFADLDVGLSGLAGAGNQVVSYLRAHPTIKYVAISALNAFDGVAPAVRAAKLNVKIIGAVPDATALSQLRAGTLDAAIASSNYEQTYAALNLFIRKAAGLDSQIPGLEKAYYLLPWLLTKTNVPASDEFPIVTDYATEFKTAWGK
jgi:ribose transport system substrate-binding protein